MYADHFGFRELPFNNTPDPRFFYATSDHEEALASLIYAAKERKGFVLLTGEIGAGKTLVTRMLLHQLGSQIAFANIHHVIRRPEDLLESVCTEFELATEPGMSATQLIRTLHDFLLAQFAQDRPVVLILDEAQNLPVEVFEQLRMIGNLEADDAKLLQIAIVGQPELQRVFLSPELRQLRQRIYRCFHLPALDRETTEAYVRHRLSVVSDAIGNVFNPGAIEAIYEHSGGLPRVVNTICDHALLSAYSANRKTIDRSIVESIMTQMLAVGESPEPAAPVPISVSRHDGIDAISCRTRSAMRVDSAPELGMNRRPVDPSSAVVGADSVSSRAPNCDPRAKESERTPTEIEDPTARLARIEERLLAVAQRIAAGSTHNGREHGQSTDRHRLIAQSDRLIRVADELSRLVNRVIDGWPANESHRPGAEASGVPDQILRTGVATQPATLPVESVLLDAAKRPANPGRLARKSASCIDAHPKSESSPSSAHAAGLVEK